MNIMANTLLAAGASPAMLHSPDWVQFMESTAGYPVSNGRPWVLDPVAISASKFRMEAGLRLAGIRPCVIRGNASEILALSSAALGDTTGADSSHDSGDALEGAKKLSEKSGAIVPVSGAVDVVTDGERVVGVVNGVAKKQQITTTGCAVTALIAAFVAANPSKCLWSDGLCICGVWCCRRAGLEMAKGPASLRMHMIDFLHGLDAYLALPSQDHRPDHRDHKPSQHVRLSDKPTNHFIGEKHNQ